jgi:hypothetical protein
MPPELLELDPQIEAIIARANAGLGLAEEQPVIFGWEGDAPEYAAAAADHDGLSTGLFGGAAGQVFTEKPAITLNLGAEAHA